MTKILIPAKNKRQAFLFPVAKIGCHGHDIRRGGESANELGERSNFDGERLLAAFFLARNPVAVSRSWAAAQLAAVHSDLRKRFLIVAGRPGSDQPDPGATVCSCFSVGVNSIVSAIRNGCHSVEAVGVTTNAGTNCGSCRAEIRGIIDGCLAATAK